METKRIRNGAVGAILTVIMCIAAMFAFAGAADTGAVPKSPPSQAATITPDDIGGGAIVVTEAQADLMIQAEQNVSENHLVVTEGVTPLRCTPSARQAAIFAEHPRASKWRFGAICAGPPPVRSTPAWFGGGVS